jgi:peptidoglycan/xylan/chitin deacetylase (PgdA/CDA1 family)
VYQKIKGIMRRFLGGFIGYCLILFGSTRRAKQWVFSERYITPIYFHNPSKQLFERCIEWLLINGFTFISTDQLVNILKGKMDVPKGAVWITFDDGWKENINNAIPAIVKYNIPVTFFITTKPVESGGAFWWNIAQKYAEKLPKPYKNNISMLWQIEENKRRELIDGLMKKLASDLSREAMTIQDLKGIANLPQITIGCHTVNHVATPNCTNIELEYEISKSKVMLENWIGKEVKYFAYPGGKFDGREKVILEKYGFVLSATIEKRHISLNDDFYLIPRLSVMDNGFFSEAVCRILGVFNPFVTLGRKMGMAP